MSQAEFLKALITIFEQTAISYRQYVDAGKTFHFAKQLKFYNSTALKLLIENKALLQKKLQEDTGKLILHYTEWSAKWNQLASEKVHQPDDIFVFANEITFPKQAEQNLKEAYNNINLPPVTPHKK